MNLSITRHTSIETKQFLLEEQKEEPAFVPVLRESTMNRVQGRRKRSKTFSPPRSGSRSPTTSPTRVEESFRETTPSPTDLDSDALDSPYYAGPKSAPHPSDLPRPPAHWLFSPLPSHDLSLMTQHLRQMLKVQS